jgi:hypothetical protein
MAAAFIVKLLHAVQTFLLRVLPFLLRILFGLLAVACGLRLIVLFLIWVSLLCRIRQQPQLAGRVRCQCRFDPDRA